MEFLRIIRNDRKLTLRKVSKELGIAECYLSQLETGKRKPSIAVAKRLAEFYKLDWTKFFE